MGVSMVITGMRLAGGTYPPSSCWCCSVCGVVVIVEVGGQAWAKNTPMPSARTVVNDHMQRRHEKGDQTQAHHAHTLHRLVVVTAPARASLPHVCRSAPRLRCKGSLPTAFHAC